jgi:hypothetical protein
MLYEAGKLYAFLFQGADNVSIGHEGAAMVATTLAARKPKKTSMETSHRRLNAGASGSFLYRLSWTPK